MSRVATLKAPTEVRDFLSHAAITILASILLCALPSGCGAGGSEAQRRGVGAACTKDTDCIEAGQTCLAFKGGYCGLANCVNDAGCPSGSACVAHTDGKNYCFLICTDKASCNIYRSVDVEANCSSSVAFIDSTLNRKACVPPS